LLCEVPVDEELADAPVDVFVKASADVPVLGAGSVGVGDASADGVVDVVVVGAGVLGVMLKRVDAWMVCGGAEPSCCVAVTVFVPPGVPPGTWKDA
jgi:hypothetical protein